MPPTSEPLGSDTRAVPLAACFFDVAGPGLEFAAGKEADRAAIKMRARSGQPVQHWYWGAVAHDMAGFRSDGPRIPIDYCHDDQEILGYLDAFTPSDDGLDVAGELVSFDAKDRAAEVLHKGRSGVPYQASIFFRPESIEEVLTGGTARVNGYDLPGPALVIRKWSLRGLAICPYGVDHRTQTQFARGPEQTLAVPQFSRETKEPAMADDTKDTAPPTQQSAAASAPPPAAPPDPRAEFSATLQRFTAKFGATHGAQWAAEGLTYEQALERHAEQLGAQLAARDAQNQELQAKLAATPRGEAAPLSAQPAEGVAAASAGKFGHLGKNLAAFAAGVKLPGGK